MAFSASARIEVVNNTDQDLKVAFGTYGFNSKSDIITVKKNGKAANNKVSIVGAVVVDPATSIAQGPFFLNPNNPKAATDSIKATFTKDASGKIQAKVEGITQPTF